MVEETTTTGLEETTTTTEKLSTAETRLANGHIKAMGFIKKVWEQGGKRYISIDYAEMLTGQDGDRRARSPPARSSRARTCPTTTSSGTRIPPSAQFAVSDQVAITTSTWKGQMNMPVTWPVFMSFWSATPPDQEAAFLRENPWWIERDGQTVHQDRRAVPAVAGEEPAR